MSVSSISTLIVLFCTIISSSFGQIPGTIDTTFVCPKTVGFDGLILSAALSADGNIVVRWDGKYFGDRQVNGLAKLNRSGALESGYALRDPHPEGEVLFPLHDGSFFLRSRDGRSITKIDRNGNHVNGFQFNCQPFASFFSDNDGSIFEVPLKTAGEVKKRNMAGEELADFRPISGPVHGFEIVRGRHILLVNSEFQLKKFSMEGQELQDFVGEASLNQAGLSPLPISLKTLPDERILIGHPRMIPVRLSANGMSDPDFNGMNTRGFYFLTFSESGSFYATNFPSGKVNLTRFDSEANLDNSFTSTTDFYYYPNLKNNPHYFFASDERITYLSIENGMLYRFVTLDGSGNLVVENRDEGFNGFVSHMVSLTNGSIMVAGQFDKFNNHYSNGIVKLQSNGSLDERFKTPFLENGIVSPNTFKILNISAMPNNQLLVQTDITVTDGILGFFPQIFLLDEWGNRVPGWRLDSSSIVSRGLMRKVVDVKSTANGEIYLLAQFSPTGLSTDRFILTKFLANGQLDPLFTPFVADQLSGIHLPSDEDVLVEFSEATENNNQSGTWHTLQRLLPGGQVDGNLTFSAINTQAGRVNHIGFDGETYVAGMQAFGERDGFTGGRQYVVKLSRQGQLLERIGNEAFTFKSDTLASRTTPFLATSQRSVLFQENSEETYTMVNRITGSMLDTTFQPLKLFGGFAHVFLQNDSNKVLVAGSFSHVNGKPFSKIVKIHNRIFSELSTKPTLSTPLFQLYPNPGHEALHISLKDENRRQIKIVSATGKTMFDFNSANVKVLQIDTCKWPAGMYLVTVMEGSNKHYLKWTKTQ